MAETIENNGTDKAIKEPEKQKTVKVDAVGTKITSGFKALLSFLVYFFCFILFPIYLIYSSSTIFLRQIQII